MYEINKINKEKKRVNMAGKILNIVLYIIIILIIIFNFILIAKSLVNPNKTPDIFGYKNFIIVSGSMEPTIMTGDTILIKEVPQSEINKNDIISFQDGGVITTHRIINVVEDNGTKKYKTKGDNNNVEDKELVTYEQIEGKYQFKINGFGKIIKFLQSKFVFALLFLLIIANCLYSNRLNKKKEIRKEKRREYEKN